MLKLKTSTDDILCKRVFQKTSRYVFKLYDFLLKLKLWQTNFAQGVLKCFPLRKLLREL